MRSAPSLASLIHAYLQHAASPLSRTAGSPSARDVLLAVARSAPARIAPFDLVELEHAFEAWAADQSAAFVAAGRRTWRRFAAYLADEGLVLAAPAADSGGRRLVPAKVDAPGLQRLLRPLSGTDPADAAALAACRGRHPSNAARRAAKPPDPTD